MSPRLHESAHATETKVGNLSRSRALASVASSLIIARSGVEFSDEAVARMAAELADLREFWELTPDQVMDALTRNEPALAFDWPM